MSEKYQSIILKKPRLPRGLEVFIETDIGKSLKDILKFFFVYYLIALLVSLLFFAYTDWSLSAFKIDMDSPLTADLPDGDYDKTFSDLWQIMELSKFIPIVLAFFAVFFSLPPKGLRRIVFTGLMFFLIGSALRFLAEGFLFFQMIKDFLALSVCILVPWLCSLVVFSYKNKSLKVLVKNL